MHVGANISAGAPGHRILADLVCGFLARTAEEMLLGRPFTFAEEQRLASPLPPTMLPVLPPSLLLTLTPVLTLNLTLTLH